MRGYGDNSNSIDPDRIAAEMEDLGFEWADKHAAAESLEEARKSLLAEIALRYKPKCKSQGETDMYALADREYREYLTKMVEARRIANRAKVRFDTLKGKLEMQRTAAATNRALMQLR